MGSKNIPLLLQALRQTVLVVNSRWLEVCVANLTCTQYWVAYLQVIQEAVWPGGGLLSTQPWPLRTQLEKDDSRQQALLCLMGVVPGTDREVCSYTHGLHQNTGKQAHTQIHTRKCTGLYTAILTTLLE